MLSIVLSTIFVVICLLLLLVVLLQQGKGGDMASAFGGSGSQAAFGARAGATLLTRATTVLGTLFMLGAMGLAILGQRGPESVLSGIDAPAVPVPTTPEPSVEVPTLPEPAAASAEAPGADDAAAAEDEPAEPVSSDAQ